MKYIIANWKMNMNIQDVINWVSNWKFDNNEFPQVLPIIAPSFLHLSVIKEQTNLAIAGQDVSIYNKGSHTGDIGDFQLLDYCKYCIVGHSERNENVDLVIRKAENVLQIGMTPIICFTNNNDLEQYKNVDGAILAWEDPENISKGGVFNPKNPREIETGIKKIRQIIGNTKVLLYGGSVNNKNANDLLFRGIDGVLVGSASLDPKHFQQICSIFGKSL